MRVLGQPSGSDGVGPPPTGLNLKAQLPSSDSAVEESQRLKLALKKDERRRGPRPQ